MTGRARGESETRSLSAVEGFSSGPVMVIGGAEDKLRDKVILEPRS